MSRLFDALIQLAKNVGLFLYSFELFAIDVPRVRRRVSRFGGNATRSV